jgi:glycosyltransferase involved in cell wall biosynthesis
MNIVIVSHLYSPNVGGVEIAVSKLAAYLVKKGNSVRILTSRFPKLLPKREIFDGIEILRLHFRIPVITPLSSIAKFSFRFVECLLELFAFCRKNKVDIVNLHYPTDNALYAVLLSWLSRAPLVTSIHGSDIESFARSSTFKRWIVGFTLKNSSYIVANSQDLSNKAKSLYGKIAGSKYIVIGNCIEIPQESRKSHDIPKGVRFILGIGRLVKVKGFDILVQAFKIFRQKTDDTHLIILGDGEEKESLIGLVHSLGLQESVLFPGNVDNNNVFDYLSKCAFLVLPSRQEAFGIVCLEAMAAGKPIVAFDVGGVSEIVKNMVNGLLVNVRTAEGLAEKMIYLYGNKELAEKLGENGKEFVRSNFSPEVILKNYLEIFEKLASNNKRKNDTR